MNENKYQVNTWGVLFNKKFQITEVQLREGLWAYHLKLYTDLKGPKAEWVTEMMLSRHARFLDQKMSLYDAGQELIKIADQLSTASRYLKGHGHTDYEYAIDRARRVLAHAFNKRNDHDFRI